MPSANRLRMRILDSPGIRTIFGGVIPIAAGVLSGAFTYEITTPAGIDWYLFYKVKSFYWLLGLSFLIYWYNREVYLYEKEISRFLDADYCIAYMRSKCLPEAAERYKELIRTGAGGELQQAMNELRKILK